METKESILWLRAGDRNTKYFYTKTKQRRAPNRITRLKNSMHQWVSNEDDIVVVASEYFQQLLTTTNPDTIEE